MLSSKALLIKYICQSLTLCSECFLVFILAYGNIMRTLIVGKQGYGNVKIKEFVIALILFVLALFFKKFKYLRNDVP
jgi:hypothetical protein